MTEREVTNSSESADKKPLKQSRFKSILGAYWHRKLWAIPLTVLLLAAIILAVPATRYPVLGLFLKENFAVVVLDETSKKPVTKAQVQLGDAALQTDNKGQAKLRESVGKQRLEVVKKYYTSSAGSVLVPIKQKQPPFKIFIQATGRAVPVTITNKVSGKPIEGVLIAAAGTEAKTDKAGKATVVLPADKSKVTAKITASGYNDSAASLQVTEQAVPQNSFQLVASGKLYFLSKLSGKIDVVKTELDGSNRQTVLPGTGKEASTDTILLASRDWKYLALKSKRDGGTNPKLYLIDTASDKLTTIDEGNADFSAIGWADHRFVYQVNRSGVENWQPKAQALKSYDAAAAKLTTIDETDAEGTGQTDFAYNQFGSVYILNSELVYNKN